jgi:putative ABC transport system permease protein
VSPGGYHALSYGDVGLAALLVVVSGAMSMLLRLQLERRLFYASVRTAAQLALVGLVLGAVFALRTVWSVLAIASTMTVVAGISAARRAPRRYAGMSLDAIASVWTSAWLVAAYALFVVLRPEPWHAPEFAIPLVGLILGNTLTGISIALDRFGEELATKRDRIETLLAFGATRWEAVRAPLQDAVRAGMIPMINAMMVTGIVSLPGMMTGQLLAGIAPPEAVKYQIVVMFLLASGTTLGTAGVVLLAYRRLFNHDHQFLHGRLLTTPRRTNRSK